MPKHVSRKAVWVKSEVHAALTEISNERGVPMVTLTERALLAWCLVQPEVKKRAPKAARVGASN